MAKILFPVRKGDITQRYDGCFDCEVYEALGLKSHAGVDIKSFRGDNLYLCEDARAYKVWDEIRPTIGSVSHGFGANFISKPDEDGVCREWLYWHTLSNLKVKEGRWYIQGTVIGYEGASGNVFQGGVKVPEEAKGKPPYPGTHLHWGCRRVQRTRSTSYRGFEFLIGPNGDKFMDEEGYYYEVIDYDNGNKGFIDPMKLDIIYFDAWINKKTEEVISSIPIIATSEVYTEPIKIGFLAKVAEYLRSLIAFYKS